MGVVVVGLQLSWLNCAQYMSLVFLLLFYSQPTSSSSSPIATIWLKLVGFCLATFLSFVKRRTLIQLNSSSFDCPFALDYPF